MIDLRVNGNLQDQEKSKEIVLKRKRKLAIFWTGFKKDKLAVIGGSIVIMMILISLLSPIIAPYDPTVGDGSLRLAPPGTSGHILGLDDQGRDILSRLIWGGRITLTAALVPILITFAVSLFLGLVAGFYSGKVSELIMRSLDVLFAFPMVLLAIAIASIVGSGMLTIMIAVFLMNIPYMTRIVYSATVNEKTEEYIEAARALGSTKMELVFKEILPNVITTLIVYSTTLIGVVIVFAAGLSFLGLGIQPPHADWGKMTSDGMKVLTQGAPHVATIPGLLILIISTSFNWLGDGLRDALDPHKRTEL